MPKARCRGNGGIVSMDTFHAPWAATQAFAFYAHLFLDCARAPRKISGSSSNARRSLAQASHLRCLRQEWHCHHFCCVRGELLATRHPWTALRTRSVAIRAPAGSTLVSMCDRCWDRFSIDRPGGVREATKSKHRLFRCRRSLDDGLLSEIVGAYDNCDSFEPTMHRFCLGS